MGGGERKARFHRRMLTHKGPRVVVPRVIIGVGRDPWMLKLDCEGLGYSPGLKETHPMLSINY